MTRRALRFLTAHKLAFVLLLAVLIRLSLLLAFYPTLFAFEQTDAVHGSGAYDTYAMNLLASGVYGKSAPGVPDAHLPPLYSYVLAAVYALLGRGGWQVGVVHILFDLIAIAALWHIGKHLFARDEWVGTLAALAYAGYPYLVFQNLTLIDTPLYMAILYLWLLMLILLRERPARDGTTWALAVGAGILLGLLALVRTNAVLLAPLGALWFIFRRPLWDSIARWIVVAVVSTLVVAPWLARNYSLYGQVVSISLNGGENFYQGSNIYTLPYFRAGYDVQWVPPPDGLTTPDGGVTPAHSNLLMDAGLRFLRENPTLIPELLWVKFLVHWSIDIAPLRNPSEGELPRLDYQGNVIAQAADDGGLTLGELPPGDPVAAYSQPLFDQIGRAVHRLYWGSLFVAGLIGLLLSFRQWREVSLLWFVHLIMMIVYVVFHPSTRYRAPTDPLWFLFSACLLISLWNGWRDRRLRTSRAVAG